MHLVALGPMTILKKRERGGGNQDSSISNKEGRKYNHMMKPICSFKHDIYVETFSQETHQNGLFDTGSGFFQALRTDEDPIILPHGSRNFI